MPLGVPTGALRAPTQQRRSSFVIQSFIDELAHRGGEGPAAVPARLLGELPADACAGGRRAADAGWRSQGGDRSSTRRMRGVLELVAEKSGWGKTTLPKGTGMGVAFHFSHRGYFAEVVQVTVSPGRRRSRSTRSGSPATSAGRSSIRCNAENQVQGAVLDGIAEALAQEITIEKGRAVQSNFHDFPLLRMRAGAAGRSALEDHRQPADGARRAGAAAGGAGAVQRDLRGDRQADALAAAVEARSELGVRRVGGCKGCQGCGTNSVSNGGLQ